MLLLNEIRENPTLIRERLKVKNFGEPGLVDEVIRLDDERKSIQTARDGNLAERNRLSKEIGDMFKSGRKDEAEGMKEKISELKDAVAGYDAEMERVLKELEEALVRIPNLPHSSVPAGKLPEDNEVVYAVDKLPELPDSALPHWELAAKYDIIDFETAVKITGSGFTMFKGKGAVLQRALISFFLDEAAAAGYLEVVPPLLVNEASAFATGQLPDKEGQMYHVTVDDLYLIPTAEVPITNIYRDTVMMMKDLPVKMVGYTPCFRREAGSYGSHVRGLNRVHQFDKVEIVQIAHPDSSYDTLDSMLKHVEGLLKKLGLPYRILRLCGGDMSFTSALTYDFEVWSAGQKKWLEVSSVSNFESYQANRLKVRFKDEEGKNRLCHTLNGSALALARIIAAILENYQTDKGIIVPEVLRPYTRFEMI